MIVSYSPAYVEGSFDTVAKAADIVASLADDPIPGVTLAEPDGDGLLADLGEVHHSAYINAVLTGEPRYLAESAGVGAWSPSLSDSVLASTAGCRQAARNAWRDGVAGSLSSGLHHARADGGMGFCTFNGVALAALEFLRLGARKVLVVDLDAHGGGGTQSILSRVRGVSGVDVSVDSLDAYSSTSQWHYYLVRHAGLYLRAVEAAADTIRDRRPDAVVYNAGMDPHEGCTIGGLRGINTPMLAERERLIFDACDGIPTAWFPAGGYVSRDLPSDSLVGLHRLTISEAARCR